MGVMQLLEGEFFTAAETDGEPKPGDIYWVPTPELEREPRILEVDRAAAQEHTEGRFRIKPVTGDHFQPSRRDRRRLPVAEMGLRDKDEAMISRAQKRPCVVLAVTAVGDLANLTEPIPDSVTPLADPTLLVAPMTSTAGPNGPYTFVPQLVARIRCLEYPQFLPLPKLEGGGDCEPRSIVRLDRLRSTHLHAGCDREKVTVTPEVLGLLRAQLRMLAGAEEPDDYREVRELAATCLPELEAEASGK